jgi:hypothetical protein
MEKHAFHLDAGEIKEFRVAPTPDTLRQTETVVAKAEPFETARGDSPDAITLAGNDAKNLGSVLADDPLRAVQSLPGITSNNDFEARFSLRGADFSHIDSTLTAFCSTSRSTWCKATVQPELRQHRSWRCTRARFPCASKTGTPAFSMWRRATEDAIPPSFARLSALPKPASWRKDRCGTP